MENATTVAIVEEFTNLVDVTKSYTLKEIKDILSAVYKTKSSKKKNNVSSDDETSDGEKKQRRSKKEKLDKDGNVKQKKKPSAYNLYIKARVEELKKENPDSTAIDRMKTAASTWKTLSDDEKNAYKEE